MNERIRLVLDFLVLIAVLIFIISAFSLADVR